MITRVPGVITLGHILDEPDPIILPELLTPGIVLDVLK